MNCVGLEQLLPGTATDGSSSINAAAVVALCSQNQTGGSFLGALRLELKLGNEKT
jgi:hypothetical protein